MRTKHSRALHRARGAARVVAHTRRKQLSRLFGLAAKIGRILEIQRIVMAAHENPAIRRLGHCSGQNGDDVADLDVFPYTPAFWNLMRVKTHLEQRTVAFELFE